MATSSQAEKWTAFKWWGCIVAPLVIVVLSAFLYMAARGMQCCSPPILYQTMQELGSSLLLLSRALSWPVVVLFGMMLLTSQRAKNFYALIGRFKSVSVLGSEVTFTEEGAKDLSQDAEGTFAAYRHKAAAEIFRLARVNRIGELLKEVFVGTSSATDIQACASKTGFRSTIHIEDLLFDQTLFQLLDYYPKKGGAGRTFSIRYGVIGLTWRFRRHQGEGAVSSKPDNLVRDWGMTDEEARIATRASTSYLCVVLEHSKRRLPLALIYMDSGQENAFGETDGKRMALANAIAQEATKVGLTDALERVVDDVEKYGTRIKIHD